jgi:hypothetical protein
LTKKIFIMKQSFFFLLIGLLTSQTFFAQNQKDQLQQLRVDVVYLASDYLEGREAGTAGERLAADYIVKRFQEMGLQPAGSNGSWFQSFDFTFKPNPRSEEAGESRTGKNIAGFIDNGAAHTVVIGAHYDHLGMGAFSSRSTAGSAIHNGADDNASGVAAMLRLAAYFAEGAAKSNNYLFLAFSAEELGLYGSKHFAENPTVELGKVNYMLNLDMVGRLNQEKSLAINGVGTSSAWKAELETIEVGGIQAVMSESGVGPSDHTSFYLQDIPVLHFFTGQHEEYHKPEDDAHLINFNGILDITNYIIALVDNLDTDGKIAFVKTQDEQETPRRASYKVTLGVMPDYVYSGKGMRIDGVMAGRAADNAGMLKGDVILKIGDTDVADIYGYMDGLSKFNQGDKVVVVFKRGEETIEKEVTFN